MKSALTATAATPLVSPAAEATIGRAAAFREWTRVLREEHERALVATAGANEQRSHQPAVRLLYVPASPDALH
jgi:hypothetical protein